MQPPPIDNSTKEERLAYVLEAWKCLHDCEACGKCRILKGREAYIFTCINIIQIIYIHLY